MAITQSGEDLVVGLESGQTYTGIFQESATRERVASQKVIKGEDNQTLSILRSGLATRRTIRGILKATGWSEPRLGDIVTINGVKHRVESCVTEHQAEERRVTLTVIKEDAINYV